MALDTGKVVLGRVWSKTTPVTKPYLDMRHVDDDKETNRSGLRVWAMVAMKEDDVWKLVQDLGYILIKDICDDAEQSSTGKRGGRNL
jgi:hypothetical protein